MVSRVEVVQAQRCRAYDLIVDDEGRSRHSELLDAFLRRGVTSPQGGGQGPYMNRQRRVIKGRYRLIFFLAEEVCDEYEKAMGINGDTDDDGR